MLAMKQWSCAWCISAQGPPSGLKAIPYEILMRGIENSADPLPYAMTVIKTAVREYTLPKF